MRHRCGVYRGHSNGSGRTLSRKIGRLSCRLTRRGGVVLAILAPGLEFNTRGLDRAITGRFPVNAANFVLQNRIPGPLFNNFDWGGFLTWYLPPYPVVIDGRTDLYGEELDQKLLTTLNGEPSYKTDPYLNDAGVVLIRRRDGLSSTLALDPRFRKVYEDQMAVVFVRQ